jgi:hypothetical protein
VVGSPACLAGAGPACPQVWQRALVLWQLERGRARVPLAASGEERDGLNARAPCKPSIGVI